MSEAASRIDDELAPGTCVGDYEVLGRLGEGGMATVYSGLHPLIGRKVAIKVIRRELCTSSEAVERFLQEARAVVSIAHPNIIDVFTFGRLDDGRCYFIMDQLDGRTLGEVLDADGPLGVIAALDALVAMCDALEAAHRAGVIHRDLKPQNVFLPAGGGTKLLDFGIAKIVGRPEPDTPHTRPGTTIGTPDYISPEQARGRDVGPPADVYSLGVVAFEMLTGQLPFVADNSADMLAAHLCRPPERPSTFRPGLPPELDALVLQMLAKEPAQRPTLALVRAALLALAASPLPESFPPVRPQTRELAGLAGESLPAIARRPPWRRITAGVGALGCVALCAAAYLERSEPLAPALAAVAAQAAPTTLAATPPPLPPPPPPPAVGALVIRLSPAGALLTVDGEPRAPDAGAWRGQLTGRHHVVASAPGRRTVSLDVDVEPGQVVEVPVALPRLAPPPKPQGAKVTRLRRDDFHSIDPWRR